MKGSAITGPVGKEAAELWPVSVSPATRHACLRDTNMCATAYRLQLRCRHVSGCLLRETVHTGGVRAAFYAQASSMISCHEGTSSQTIFSAQNQLHPVLGQRKRYTTYNWSSGFLAASVMLQIRICELSQTGPSAIECDLGVRFFLAELEKRREGSKIDQPGVHKLRNYMLCMDCLSKRMFHSLCTSHTCIYRKAMSRVAISRVTVRRHYRTVVRPEAMEDRGAEALPSQQLKCFNHHQH
jgi:hypothetical protein